MPSPKTAENAPGQPSQGVDANAVIQHLSRQLGEQSIELAASRALNDQLGAQVEGLKKELIEKNTEE